MPNKVSEYAKQSLRTLLIAYNDSLNEEWMVTGDNAISKDAGIIPKDYEHTDKSFVVMEGKNFRNYVFFVLF